MKTLALLVFLLLTSSGFAQDVPPFANITSVEYRGTGCDAESARVVMTPDLSYLSVLYDRFSVEVGTGTASPLDQNQQKNCAIIVKFDLPAGWSLQFDEVEYRGFVALPTAMASARQMISVETLHGKGRNFQENIIQGPKTENFVTVYRNSVIEQIGKELVRGHGAGNGKGKGRRNRSGDFFACSDRTQQATLKIRSRIAVKNNGDKTHPLIKMIVDSTDASFNQKLRINWNQCVPG